MKTTLLAAWCISSLAAAGPDAGGAAPAPVAKAAPMGAADAGPAAPEPPKVPFNQNTVLEVVKAHLGQIQDCYNQMNATKGGKPQEGKLAAHWVITTEGISKGATIVKKGTTLKDAKLNECVVAVILAMEFPKPPKDFPVNFPFNLKAEHEQ
jgi:hypothetical protein